MSDNTLVRFNFDGITFDLRNGHFAKSNLSDMRETFVNAGWYNSAGFMFAQSNSLAVRPNLKTKTSSLEAQDIISLFNVSVEILLSRDGLIVATPSVEVCND
ncbi:MAG TPA: hypothetical protein ENG03_00985 [Thioploca sp.]|nr:MAG: hypothetical protein DRR08_15950 [Gammaproteobacteria bacterium]HDN25675.1 hypothetical protein [Thioploca sp.]